MTEYNSYLQYYANKCNNCKGNKRIYKDNIWFVCPCQNLASVKYKFDQIKIYPEELKNKTWENFTGISSSGKLTVKSLVSAKSMAMEYCLGKSGEKNVIKNRLKKGTNLVISGDFGSGKSLLGFLVLKEIAIYSIKNNVNISFDWQRAINIVDAARWDQKKSINNELIDHWGEVDFLFIDNINLKPKLGDHRSPPDINSINRIFSHRMVNNKPTVLLCNESLLKKDKYEKSKIIEEWGEEFFSLINNENNYMIQLEKI